MYQIFGPCCDVCAASFSLIFLITSRPFNRKRTVDMETINKKNLSPSACLDFLFEFLLNFWGMTKNSIS